MTTLCTAHWRKTKLFPVIGWIRHIRGLMPMLPIRWPLARLPRLLTAHYLLLLLYHLFLSFQLVTVLRILNFQCFFCNHLSLFIWRRRLYNITCFLNMSGFRGQNLFFLVKHGGWLIWLCEHVKKSRFLLSDFVVLNDPLLPLQLIDQHISLFRVEARVELLWGGIVSGAVEGRAWFLFLKCCSWLVLIVVNWLWDQGGWLMRLFCLLSRRISLLVQFDSICFDNWIGIHILFKFNHPLIGRSLNKVLHA